MSQSAEPSQAAQASVLPEAASESEEDSDEDSDGSTAAAADLKDLSLGNGKASPQAHASAAASPAAQEAVPDDGHAAVPDSMDAVVEGLLIAGLHELDDDSLPMQTNEFYSKVVLGCKPAGAQLLPVLQQSMRSKGEMLALVL